MIAFSVMVETGYSPRFKERKQLEIEVVRPFFLMKTYLVWNQPVYCDCSAKGLTRQALVEICSGLLSSLPSRLNEKSIVDPGSPFRVPLSSNNYFVDNRQISTYAI